MQAWRFDEDGSFTLTTVDEPLPGPHEFLLDVKAAGVCHSDVGIIDGPGRAWIARTPITLGHEVAGVVAAVGPDPQSDIAVGERVALLGTGLDNAAGISRDGGYAYLTPALEEISFEQIGDGIERLRRGDVQGRLVARVAGSTSPTRQGQPPV